MIESATTDADFSEDGLDAPLDATDHIAEARRRARDILSCEAHLGDADDWRQALVTARHAVMLVWIAWVALHGFAPSVHVGPILIATGLGASIYLGLAAAAATRVRLRYLEDELSRERDEIEHSPDHEREEVRVLYAAKGFREPLLTQIVDTLCADDDRLLKVMMEEEMGLFIQHVNHPLLVGAWNMIGAMAATLVLAGPTCFQSSFAVSVWIPAGAASMLIALGTVSARLTHRGVAPVVVNWLTLAVISGGLTYFLAELLARSA